MKTIPIDQAEAKDLRYYAKTVLGLDGITNMMNGQTLRSKILAAAPGTTEVTVAEDPESLAQADAEQRQQTIASQPVLPPSTPSIPLGLAPRQAAQYRYDPKVKVYIPVVPGPGGDRHVPVAVNNDVVEIGRDQWIEVPYRFYLALKDAVASELTPKNGEDGRLEIVSRDVLSYPFNVDPTTLPSQEQIDEWNKRVGDIELA